MIAGENPIAVCTKPIPVEADNDDAARRMWRNT